MLTLLYRPLSAQTLQVDTRRFAEVALHTYLIEGYADFLTADGNDVWVTNTGRIQKLTADSRVPVMTVIMPDPCGAPVLSGAELYIASCKARAVYEINTATGNIDKIIPTAIADPGGEISLAYGAGSLWVLSDSSGVLSRIDPGSGRLVARISVLPHSFCAVFGFGSVWVTNSGIPGSVQRINPATNQVIATIGTGPCPHFLAAGENGIWTLNQRDGSISHLDPVTNSLVATIPAGLAGTGGDISAGAGKIWVRSKNGTALLTIDPKTNKPLDRYGPLCGSGAVRVAGKYTWVTAHDIHAIWVLPNY